MTSEKKQTKRLLIMLFRSTQSKYKNHLICGVASPSFFIHFYQRLDTSCHSAFASFAFKNPCQHVLDLDWRTSSFFLSPPVPRSTCGVVDNLCRSRWLTIHSGNLLENEHLAQTTDHTWNLTYRPSQWDHRIFVSIKHIRLHTAEQYKERPPCHDTSPNLPL